MALPLISPECLNPSSWSNVLPLTQAMTHVVRLLSADDIEFVRELLRGELTLAMGPFRIT